MYRDGHRYSQDTVSWKCVHCHREGDPFPGSASRGCMLPPVGGLGTPLMSWVTTEHHVPSILAEAGN